MSRTRFQPFGYLHFARHEMSGARHELCMSGVPDVDIDVLGPEPPEIRRSRGGELHAEWRQRVAARWGLPEDELLFALGASGGVYLSVAACASLVAEREGRAARVAIESPAYGVFEGAARLAGADVRKLERSRDDAYRLDHDELARILADGADIVCLSDLQNPVGVALTESDVAAIRRLAREHGATIVLDEVYRDFLPGDVGSAYRSGEPVVCTSSMTKCYGVGKGRCGWIAGPADVLARAESILEITHGDDPLPSLDVAVRALRVADDLIARGRAFASRSRGVIDRWIEATDGVDWTPPVGGLTGFVHVAGMKNSLSVARTLRADLDVQVVPGCFFGEDDALRVSFGLPPARLQQALETLTLGLRVLAG